MFQYSHFRKIFVKTGDGSLNEEAGYIINFNFLKFLKFIEILTIKLYNNTYQYLFNLLKIHHVVITSYYLSTDPFC